MGGLARRVSYIKAFRQRSNTEVPTLFVDAGNLFTDDRFSADQLPAEVMTKNKWVVKGYGDFHHDAANVSYVDLPYIGELLKKDGYDKRVQEYPFIERLVSANIQPLDDQHRAPAPYVVREITLKRGAPGQKLRIGIVGFSEAKPTGPNDKENTWAGFQINDPFEAAKKVLPELKKKVDFIVALAYMPIDGAQRLATENAEIDSIIAARQTSTMDEPQHFNRATITYAYNQTKYLGELRLYARGDGSVENQINRYVALDSTIPDDPAALDVVTAAHTEFTNEQNKVAHSDVASPKPAALLGGVDSPYAGGETCAGCHEKEHQIWLNSRHAHAMGTLEKKSQQFDNECVRCHVVGYEKGGFQSLYTTPQFANVQCEECHGPGRAHASNPSKGYGFVQTPVGCMRCHKEPNDPDFNFAVYWPKIKH
ncbi:MAG TPA: multiheme c-type cytochrome [Blastocatellia bacterium]|nr:multiheme c-type cytochrome [Blastocatellia bacterium]